MPRQGFSCTIEHMPAVSVLMPCYNAGETLVEALQSLEGQTYSDFEVIAVDDGSTDMTSQVLHTWAVRDHRFQVLVRPHRGIIAALNDAVSVCRSRYIARMDADDFSYPARLERQVNYLDEHPEVDVAGCLVEGFPSSQVREGYRMYIEWLNSLVSDADIRREIFVESPMPHPSIIIRRECLVEAGGYQEHGWAEDYDLWLRLYLAGKHFAKVPQVLLGWRESPERLTRTDSRYTLENFLRAKAHYIARGPAAGRDAVFVWGAGIMGRRFCKPLNQCGLPLAAFIDIDPRKIGRRLHGLPILAAEELPSSWSRFKHPILLAAVGARGARALIRQRLSDMELREEQDWWSTA
jgi:glycosyltransferase involved in cell wall biosynthesis